MTSPRERLSEASRLVAELDGLLSESPATALERQGRVFDETVDGRPIVLFGAGGLGRRVLAGLRANGMEPAAFADNGPARQGQAVDGLQVLSPADAAARFAASGAFIVTIWSPPHRFLDTRRQLRGLGCRTVVPFEAALWRFPDDLLPYYRFDIPGRTLRCADRIRQAFSLLEDPGSRAVFMADLRWRLHLDYDALPRPSSEDQYFPSGIVSLRPDEVFVDAGAFRGDTLRSFLSRAGGTFGKFIAFEPDPQNFEALRNDVSSLPPGLSARILLRRAALGAAPGTARLASGGTAAARLVDGGDGAESEVVRLDDALAGARPTFIKLDIEGGELDALLGARGSITSARPTVAVSVYHRSADLWELPLLLDSMVSDYRFHLRAHEEDGRDMVAYAVPGAERPSAGGSSQ